MAIPQAVQASAMSQISHRRGERIARFYRGRLRRTSAAAAVLLLSYGLMLSSALRHSATVDEQSHLFRGVAYVSKGASHFLLGHPLLASTLSALPLLSETELRLPTDSAAWAAGNWPVAGDQFLWQLAAAPLRLLFLGRLVVIWLTLVMGALVWRWGRELAGAGAALAAMVMVLLDPNVLAHGRLITGDVPLALFFVLALYGYWRFAQALERGQRTWPGLVLAGVGLGLAAATKFNAAVALPVLGLQAIWLAWRRRHVAPLLALVPIVLLAWLMVTAFYQFELWRGYLPGGSFWADLVWQQRYVGKEHGAFFLGRLASERQWLYFPVAFVLKTPLPTLLLLGLSFLVPQPGRAGRQRQSLLPAAFLLLPALVYFLASIAIALNIGFRYLIPALPLLYLFASVRLLGAGRGHTRRPLRAAAVLLLVSLAVRSATAWPDYISFFNVAAGGNGWRLLADSNVDWGQDLPALARWQETKLPEGAPLYLSYFGTAHPSAYGVKAQALPTWPQAPEQANPFTQPYNPDNPAPGFYAISVNNLHGLVLGQERELFSWFRGREPQERLGGSIFLYEVTATGPPANLALSGLRPAMLAAPLQEKLGTNDVRLRWFDHRTSFVWPAGGGWMVVAGDLPPPVELETLWPAAPEARSGDQALYQLDKLPLPAWLQPGDWRETPLRYRGMTAVQQVGSEVSFLTAWEVAASTDRPLKIFVHARDDQDIIIGQWDGLDVLPSSWWPGDVFVQSHRFDLPADAPPSHLVAGIYDGETMERILEFTLASE
jgi:4-amino-4-deoxy-L-arabinose transferase-like glycosyltransferase